MESRGAAKIHGQWRFVSIVSTNRQHKYHIVFDGKERFVVPFEFYERDHAKACVLIAKNEIQAKRRVT